MFIAASCNILPRVVKSYRQDVADHIAQDIAMIVPEYDARDLLAANVKALMDEHPTLKSPRLLAKACFWPAGAKKGDNVSERQIRYLLDTRADTIPPVPSPSLDLIVAIAAAFGKQAWELIVEEKMLRLWIVGKVFTPSEAVSNAKVEQHLPLPPTPTREKKATSKRRSES